MDGVLKGVEDLSGGPDGLEVVAQGGELGGLRGHGVLHVLGQLARLLAGATSGGGHGSTPSGAVR
jgi:hypothetical protein